MRLKTALLLLAAMLPVLAQRSISGEAEIRQALEKLNTLGSVMMIAAHPDDENTALLAYLARGRHVRTAYLALTRGEGGQNLIGSEQGDQMGIIRTQELLAARKIDGAEQYFTRAIDFGFSKIADETLTQWPREQVLADVVWNIRRFRPDEVPADVLERILVAAHQAPSVAGIVVGDPEPGDQAPAGWAMDVVPLTRSAADGVPGGHLGGPVMRWASADALGATTIADHLERLDRGAAPEARPIPSARSEQGVIEILAAAGLGCEGRDGVHLAIDGVLDAHEPAGTERDGRRRALEAQDVGHRA